MDPGSGKAPSQVHRYLLGSKQLTVTNTLAYNDHIRCNSPRAFVTLCFLCNLQMGPISVSLYKPPES